MNNDSSIKLDHYATQDLSDYKVVKYEAAKTEYPEYNRGAHAMIYSRKDGHCYILMTMRFDGYLGFPGGMADEGESIEASLLRELHEEIALDHDVFTLQPADALLVHINHKTRLALYFYVKEVSFDDIEAIRQGIHNARDFGTETLGMCYIPLHIGDDGYSGLPRFLCNKFIGNTTDQLMYAFSKLHLLPEETLHRTISAWKQLKESQHKL